MYPKSFLKAIVTFLTASTLISACLLCSCLTEAHVHDLRYVPAVEATCEQRGNIEHYVCGCGKYFADEEGQTEITWESTVIQRKSHQFTAYGFDDNVHYKKCAVCGTKQADTDGEHFLKYAADEYEHYRYCTLCDYRTESEAHVPDEEGDEFCKICRFRRPKYELSADGTYYIVSGASQPFKEQITELVIPDTYLGLPVKEVGERAFANCNNLEKVTFGKNVISIADYAFLDNLKLKTLVFNEGLLEIRFRAFHGCSALEEVDLPSNLFNLGNGVFYGCDALKRVSIPKSINTISERLFYECPALETVELTDSIKSYGVAAFSRSGLKEFTVNDGVLAVAQTMFYDCPNLETVTLPASVTSIGSGAFMDCPMLKKIIFSGTEEQWNSIEFGSMWDRDSDFTVEFLK